MKKITTFILAMLLMWTMTAQKKSISMDVLKDKIAGAWLGQMVGNIYGLPYENKFIELPGDQAKWPLGFDKSLIKLRQYDGAFSDDDTDVEYMYLTLMEKYGTEPTYEQIKEFWMYHIRDRVWLANRAALGLMHYGFTPPFTGNKDFNPHWYQIDPQLINEIWAYTAPGMVAYVATKSAWAARITSDDWATSPTVHYGAMYAMAFFESNMKKLIIDALQYLPANDRYAKTVREIVALYEKYPNNWQQARQEMAEKYYINEAEQTKTIWNANLNGACGLLSMLYGHGDLQLTMDLGASMGFDADNQTATVGGILGIINGASKLPKTLTMPIEGWSLPFNDKYINITRYDMPDAKITDMINRTVDQALKLIVEKGGKVTKNTVTINTKAVFNPPMEFCVGPNPVLEVNKTVDYDFYSITNKQYQWKLTKGSLPDGLVFSNGKITGTPTTKGKYNITLSLSDGKKTINKDFELIVRGKNIAPEADSIIANVRKTNTELLYKTWITFGKPIYAENVNVINDGNIRGDGSVFYSLATEANIPKVDYFGYHWNEKRNIAMIAFNVGCMEEFGGWYSDVNIQYKDENGHWKDVGKYKVTPELPKTDIVFIQAHFVEYLFEFEPVLTDEIRIIGDTKTESHWNKDTKNTSNFISITELSVY
jgi:ADP-ribosylglycohydrolase